MSAIFLAHRHSYAVKQKQWRYCLPFAYPRLPLFIISVHCCCGHLFFSFKSLVMQWVFTPQIWHFESSPNNFLFITHLSSVTNKVNNIALIRGVPCYFWSCLIESVILTPKSLFTGSWNINKDLNEGELLCP